MGMAMGVSIGTASGVGTDNLALWLSLGVAIGAALGFAMQKKGGNDGDAAAYLKLLICYSRTACLRSPLQKANSPHTSTTQLQVVHPRWHVGHIQAAMVRSAANDAALRIEYTNGTSALPVPVQHVHYRLWPYAQLRASQQFFTHCGGVVNGDHGIHGRAKAVRVEAH